MDPPLHFIIFGPYNLAKRILNENYIYGKKRNEFVSSCYLLSFLSHHNFSWKCFYDDFGLFDWMFGLVAQFLCSARDLRLLAGEFRSTGGTLFKILIWTFSSLWCNCVHTLFCSYIIQENFYQCSFFLLYNASSCVTSSVESACALMIISCIFQKS